ncbi:hypothetical protein DRQ53_07835 [bacterium]|nr:MAG: hypothetical protein DRQ53_07835 [bacterium]
METRTLRTAITKTSANALRKTVDDLDAFLEDNPGAVIESLKVKKGTVGGRKVDQLVITVRL